MRGVYLKAQELRDELMGRQATVRLRRWLSRSLFAYDKTLNGVKYLYGDAVAQLPPDEQSTMAPLKRVFLSALVRHAAHISVSKYAEELDAMLMQSPKLMKDYCRGLIFGRHYSAWKRNIKRGGRAIFAKAEDEEGEDGDNEMDEL